MLLGMLQGNTFADDELSSLISQQGWKTDDEYICVCMDSEDNYSFIGSATSFCNQVEGRIPGSKAVVMGEEICVVINRSLNSGYSSELAYIIRDGLFKAGFCKPFHDIRKLKRRYLQASIALEYCKKRNDMRWYCSFCDVAVDYAADMCCSELTPGEICSDELDKLIEYDEKNHAELYKTLKTYIWNEKNTVATSRELFIGRSTLFYRLQKIRKVSGLDAERISDPVKNLYLRLSIYLIERQEQM